MTTNKPTDGEALPRYGVQWNGAKQPITVPMVDGYWTPWHLAQSECDALAKALEGLERVAKVVSDNSDAVCRENNQLRVECDALRRDAELYRALRAMHWYDSPLAVVQNPKEAVKPGTYCPRRSQLDEILKEYLSETPNPGET